ncbi:MAG: tRNA (adenosine(37)-N6)-threonylcarbamoyltransferase complex dimerization subunit type 1 TsaB [Verrucomicrobiales bacterium]|nr:tRNA (adenosine(37)-N6)-threonylcarbamoyltransferase complex dimerization subunit type 1 TsaB [Verrucomicrobiales bacterium]
MHRSVAVLDSVTGRAGQAVQSEGRVTEPFRLIRAALDAAGIEREAVGRIAIGLGPGSYTGIRNAIAIAQGWQFAAGVGTVGLSSVAALAAGLHAAGRRGRFRLVVDAQRGEFHESSWRLDDRGAVETTPLRISRPDAIRESLRPDEVLVGPDAQRLAVTGELPGGGGEQRFPAADDLARIAVEVSAGVPAEALEPIYLREVAFAKAPPSRTLP